MEKDVKVIIRMPDGHLGEVIVATPEMLAAKKQGHALYEKAQNTTDAIEYAKLQSQMKKLYGQAEVATAKRLASASVTTDPSSVLPGANGLPLSKLVADKVLPSETSLTGTPSTSKNVIPGDVNLKSVIDNKPFNKLMNII
jgi:hypothetical protein